MNEIAEVQNAYAVLWQKLGYSPPPYPLITEEPAEGQFVEFRDGKYRHVVTERGTWLHVMETPRLDELLSWIALDITGNLANEEAFKVPGSENPANISHRQNLTRQVELLRMINSEWADARCTEIERNFGYRMR